MATVQPLTDAPGRWRASAVLATTVTVQLAAGFALTAATMWLVPAIQGVHGWAWALALLAPGPLLSAVAMHRLDVATHGASITPFGRAAVRVAAAS